MAILGWDNFERIHGRPEGARGAFEDLCFELIRKEYNTRNVQKIRPYSGDHGIDICVNDIGIEPIKIYQCKYFRDSLGESQKNQIRESFKTIVSDEKFKACSWTLMLPHDMSFEENLWWNDWKKRIYEEVPDIQISCMCGQEIIQKLREYNLYERYFTVPLPPIETSVLLKESFEDVLESYAKNYTSVLFLQEEDEPQIELRDLYIEMEYEIFLSDVDELEDVNIGLIEYLNLFINYDGKASKSTMPILFIEGHAGIGKTSFISKLAYEYRNNNILSGWNLYIIRLRDLIPEGDKVNFSNPWQDFYRYLNIGLSFSEFMREMNQSILILEGFDELSMIDNIQNENKSKYFNKVYNVMGQYQSNCRLIVTSRPDYIVEDNDWNKITACKIVIRMKHLSAEKKQEWLDLASKKNMAVSYTLRNAILTEQKEEIQAIISTPFTLYLIVHNKIHINNSFELWNVYRKIFGKEMVQKSYDRIAHPSEQLAEFIFKITCEIAFYMYKNNRLDILWKDIDCILQEIEISDDDVESIKKMGIIKNAVLSDAKVELRKLLKNNYALHTYYKRSANGGGLAFIHNYIKDYFICEKISITLTEAYKELNPNELNSNDIENLNLTFYKLFSDNFLDDKVIDFLLSNARMELKTNVEERIWIQRECGTLEQRIFPIVFSDMLINGFCYDNKQIERIDGEIIEKPINEFYNLWILFKRIYALNQNSDDYVTLLINANFKTGARINFFRILINELLRMDKNFLAEVNLREIDLNNTHLNKSQLYHCDFTRADLYSVDFSDSDIEKSDLKSAKCIKANFRNTSLKDVNAYRTIFNNADMRDGRWENVNLEKAHFVETALEEIRFTNCRFVNTDFSNANLHKTIFHKAVLKNCKFFKTILREAELKYAQFHTCIFRHVDLQYANLQYGIFENTTIKNCNFEGTDLSRVDLSNQELTDCNLEKCILTGTNFIRAKLKKISLKENDLSNAILNQIEIFQSDLSEVNLKNSNLNGIKMSKVSLIYGDLTFSKMSGAMIEKSDMRYAKLYSLKGESTDFNGTNFNDAYLMKAMLVRSNLKNCKFRNADLRNADLQYADFSNADLSEAHLEGADLRNAILEGANLEGTVLTGANLSNANLKNARVKNTILRGAIGKNGRTKKTTILHNTNLEGVRINGITALRQEDLLHMLMQADCSKANFKDVPLDIRKMLE